ncbi:MAG TPA: sugar phosphate nucleotidyltransferase [Steroidobacter sp.]
MRRGQNRWDTHWDAGHNWALVLAAGEGSRLQALTTTASGVAIPKQFCSMGGHASLLQEALWRAQAVASPEQTCAIVAERHRRWWQALPLGLPLQNLIRQPLNRGTANGILLPLLHIVQRDPEATVLVLPSDHYVRNEEVLALSLRRAMRELEHDPEHLILLGITPEEPDPELGYIVAEGSDPLAVRSVHEFVEKPSASAARALIARGGVWNSFIFAAHARTLVRAFEARCGDLVAEMAGIVALPRDSATSYAHLCELYERLPALDFSADILQRSPSLLKLLTVPACGWSDLGTPRRLIEAVVRLGTTRKSTASPALGNAAFLDLTADCHHARLQA